MRLPSWPPIHPQLLRFVRVFYIKEPLENYDQEGKVSSIKKMGMFKNRGYLDLLNQALDTGTITQIEYIEFQAQCVRELDQEIARREKQ